MRSRPCAAGAAERCDIGAQYADALDERGECELRVAVRCFGLIRDHGPGRFVETGVEAGQHHGAVRQFRDGREQCGGGRDRAGGAGGDHRVGAFGEPLRLGFDQLVAAFGRFDAVFFGEDGRPLLADEFQKVERLVPVFVVFARHQAVELRPIDLARRYVVHQPRQILRELKGGDRIIGDQRRRAAHARGNCVDPFQDQRGERHRALQAADRVGQRQRCLANGGFGEGDFVLVEIAERDDARQKRCVRALEKFGARQKAGAPGRQIKRGAGKFERIGRGREAFDQFAGQ